MDRGLLLLDDEPNIVAALTRLLRRDGYQIYSSVSCFEALEILKTREIGVIVVDQRMPEMLGSEFLERAKAIKPHTMRIVLTGYTELSTVTQAVNQGAVYKFLIKPWEDEVLREQVFEAFRQYELQAENDRLTAELKRANLELCEVNKDLERRVDQKAREILSNVQILRVAQEVLDSLPIGVIGIANDGLIAAANQCAVEMLGESLAIGLSVSEALPEALIPWGHDPSPEGTFSIGGRSIQVRFAQLGARSRGKGYVVLLIPEL